MNTTRIKIEITYYLCRLGILTKNSNLDYSKIPTLPNITDSAFLNVSSSNNLVEICLDGERKFLRFCDSHHSKEFVIENIVKKFCAICGCKEEDMRALLNGSYNNKRFFDMGCFNDPASNVRKYFINNDLSLLGMNQEAACRINKNVVDTFVHFCWSEIATWKLNHSGGDVNLFHFNRSKCQEILYDLFNVGRLICHTNLRRLNGRYPVLCSIMEDSGGVNPIHLGQKKIRCLINNSIKRDLLTMHLMDILCFERDHRPGNYSLILEKSNNVQTIKVFDNDSTFAFFPSISVTNSLVGCSPLINKKGFINSTDIDKEFAETFMRTKCREVFNSAKPYLNKLQLLCLIIRFIRIKNAIRRSCAKNKLHLFTRSQPIGNTHFISEGKSYFDCLMEWEENLKDSVTVRQGQFPKIKISI